MQMPGFLKAAFFAVGAGALGMGASGCTVYTMEGRPARSAVYVESQPAPATVYVEGGGYGPGYGYNTYPRERVVVRQNYPVYPVRRPERVIVREVGGGGYVRHGGGGGGGMRHGGGGHHRR